MYDKPRIASIISDMEFYIERIRRMKISAVQDLDELRFYASSMIMFNILNRMMDLAGEIVASNNFGNAESYLKLFIILEREKIIDKKMLSPLDELVKLRNNFSHQYEKIDETSILEGIRKLKIIEDFIEEVKREVKKK
jgi:uncharacterized protein YutE (UPF0331/DUF86 family)